MRNLNNISASDSLNNYPIENQPLPHSVLVYEDGTFRYEIIAPGGGISIVQSVGSGQSIIKSVLANTLTLKSLQGANQNIVVSSLANELSFSLNSDLNFSQDQYFHLDDGGSSTLLNLFFQATYGILTSIPMQISNQGRIDINGLTYFNSIVDGTPAASKYLALDADNKLIMSTVADVTNAVNLPGPNFGWFMNKVGNNLEFRTFKEGLNFNVGIEAGQYVFNVETVLDSIQQINPNPPNSPFTPTFTPENVELRIGSQEIFLDNFEVGSPLPFVIIQNQRLTSGGLISVGTGASIFKQYTNSGAEIKSIVAGQNINITTNTNEINIESTSALTNITSINSGSPLLNFAVFSNNIAFPTIPNNPALLGTKCLYIDETTKNIFYDSTVKTLGFTSVGVDLLSPLGNAEYPILRGLQAGPGISLTTSNNVININNTLSPVATNIYNTNGQMTDNIRVVSGLTPGSLNNKLQLDNLNLNLVNSIAYDQEYIGTTAADGGMLCFASGGTYSKFVVQPYNYLSTVCYFTMASTYGTRTSFYQSTGDTTVGNLVWMFEIEVHQRTAATPQAFCASFAFNANAQLLPNTFYIKPTRTSLLNQTSPQNVIGLEVVNTQVGINYTWDLCLVSYGLGLVGTTAEYYITVKDKGPSLGKSITKINSTAVVTPSQNYLENFQFVYSSTLGPWPNILAYYNRPGCDLQITVMGQVQNATANTVGTLSVRFNGVDVYVINTRIGQNNSVVPVHGTKRIKFIELLNSGAISLANPITVSFFGTGTGSNFANAPFVLDIQYV
jgi:hypothetical protein